MDFISDKLTSIAGPALSGINEMKRRRKAELEENANTSAKAMSSLYGFKSPTSSNKLSAGIPFGGDTFSTNEAPPPPPIGFRTDLIATTVAKSEQLHLNEENKLKKSDSDASLYQADTWSRLWFQRVMLLSLIRLLLFVRKVYEDFHATKTYNKSGHVGHFLIAAATLFLPTIIFTIYRVSRYLQIVLPSKRALESNAKSPYPAAQGANQSTSDDDAQLRRALISTSLAGQQDEDGLVTARQTPTNLNEDFHDSRSQQDRQSPIPASAEETSKAPTKEDSERVKENIERKNEEFIKETVEIDKLGELPDKQSVRIALGASEQLLHGVLFIFWQLKRQVDVLGYLVERSCLWRKASDGEKEELSRLRTGSDGLEWFQDFYAAFLAILMQVYTISQHWSGDDRPTMRFFALNSAPSGNPSAGADFPDSAISNSAKALSETFLQQALSNRAIEGNDLLIISELMVSSLVIFSLLIAVRRKDDGPLTLGLSMLGWGSIFASRILIIALAFVHIKWPLMLAFVACHVLGITCWIYKIALDSHNGNKSERGDEMRWNLELEKAESGRQTGGGEEIELKSDQTTTPINSGNTLPTNQWTLMEHVSLLAQISTLFALPSLFYWPIMFNLKAHYRPFKYLVLIMTQNLLLIVLVWYRIALMSIPGQWYLLGAVGGFSIVGFVFVALYISCKPSLTEYFARADQLFNEAEKAGIYFEFCSRVFKLPDLNIQAFKRLMNQTEKQIETRVVEEEEEIELE